MSVTLTNTSGATWVYFVNGNRGQHSIFIARESAGGGLEVFDCVRLDDEVDSQAVDPDVLQMADGTYRLFYNTLVSGRPNDTNEIISAASTDGIHFTRESTLVEGNGVLNPSGIQLTDGSWVLTYATEAEVFIAESSDGFDFTVTESFAPAIPELAYIPELDELRLYGAGRTGLTLHRRVGDGAWVEDETSAPRVQDPSVLRLSGDSWRLYYRTAVPQ